MKTKTQECFWGISAYLHLVTVRRTTLNANSKDANGHHQTLTKKNERDKKGDGGGDT